MSRNTEKQEIDLLRERIIELVRKDLSKAAIILAEWIKQPAGARSKGAKKPTDATATTADHARRKKAG